MIQILFEIISIEIENEHIIIQKYCDEFLLIDIIIIIGDNIENKTEIIHKNVVFVIILIN